MLIYLCVAIRIDVSLLFCLCVNYIIHINIIYIYIYIYILNIPSHLTCFMLAVVETEVGFVDTFWIQID